MDPNANEIKEYLIRKGLFENPDVTVLGKGEGNENFLAEANQNIWVVRTTRLDIPDHRSLLNEHVQLRFLESEGINFAPQSLFYDPEKEIHVISFIPGKDCSILDLPKEYLGLFIQHLVQIENLPYEQFKTFSEQTKTELKTPETTQQLFQRIGLNWYKTIVDHKSDSEVTEILSWIDPKFEFVQDEIYKQVERIRYKHGDLRWFPGGGNLRLDAQKLSFIDWESSGFTQDCFIELGDVIASIPNPQENSERINYLISEYGRIVNRSPEMVRQNIGFSIKFSKLTDVLWAGQKYLLLRDAGSQDWPKYREMTLDRMRMGNSYY